MATAATQPRVGPLLRDWRKRRRLSQLELALGAGVSARHLSFVETGRSRPSPEMVLTLSEALEVPYREQNQLLLAAGHAPAFPERSLEDPDLEPVREAIDLILRGHEPYPAVVVDRHWNLVAANAAIGPLVAGADPSLLEPPVNVVRLSLHPDGMAPRIENLGEWHAHILERLERQAAITGDPHLVDLAREVAGYPAPPHEHGPASIPESREIFAPLRLRTEDGSGTLSFFSTIATFGTAVEVTTSELAIESFFPADQETARALAA